MTSVSNSNSDLVTVYLDEGALDGDYCFPSACAVVVSKPDLIRERINDTKHDLLLRPDFALEPKVKTFITNGFHHVDDNVTGQIAFLDLLATLDFQWFCSTNLNSESDPYEMLPDQFFWLVCRILQNLRGRQVSFIFEENSRLNRAFRQIVNDAVTRTSYDRALVSTTIEKKANVSLAIADYCISVTAKAIYSWSHACCDLAKLGKDHQFRTYARLEPSCSVLFAADRNKTLSSRSSRLGDKTYFEQIGQHHDACSKRATTPVRS